MGLKQCPSNAWNPQSNAILERIHQVLADGLVTFDLENKLINVNEEDPFDEYLTAVSYAIRAIGEYRANNHLSFGHFFKVVIWPISADGEFLKYRRKISARLGLF